MRKYLEYEFFSFKVPFLTAIIQLSNIPADLSAFVRSETRRTIERNSFEIPARVKTDPILNNYLTQTMENNTRSGVRIEQICVVF